MPRVRVFSVVQEHGSQLVDRITVNPRRVFHILLHVYPMREMKDIRYFVSLGCFWIEHEACDLELEELGERLDMGCPFRIAKGAVAALLAHVLVVAPELLELEEVAE